MEKKYVMAIEQGTTGTRVILFTHGGDIHCSAYREVEQVLPRLGWVGHEPMEYCQAVVDCAREGLERGKAHPAEIAAIGITNQRGTTILVDNAAEYPDAEVRSGNAGCAGHPRLYTLHAHGFLWDHGRHGPGDVLR
jgi:glycerol kinase